MHGRCLLAAVNMLLLGALPIAVALQCKHQTTTLPPRPPPCRHNEGVYLQTTGLLEQVLADKLMGYMKDREQDKQPFMIYYAPYAIHRK
jgi:hypothetical protein